MAMFLLKKREVLPGADGQNESTQMIGARDGNGVLHWVRTAVSTRWWLRWEFGQGENCRVKLERMMVAGQ